jgi:hypothetical protein
MRRSSIESTTTGIGYGPDAWSGLSIISLGCPSRNPGQPDVVCTDDGQLAGQGRLEYPIRKSHPIIRWLPSKLAAWIDENFGQKLQIPPKRDVEWTAAELNAILENNLVPGGQRHDATRPI